MRQLVYLVHPSLAVPGFARAAAWVHGQSSPSEKNGTHADTSADATDNQAVIRTVILPVGTSPDDLHVLQDAGIQIELLVPRRYGRLAGYRGLTAALRRLVPHAVHYHGVPGHLLALQLARHCQKSRPGCALVLEFDHSAFAPLGGAWRTVDRHVLSTCNAVVARHLDGLAIARSRGFDGVGVVSGSRTPAVPLVSRTVARIRLALAAPVGPVFGFVGPLVTGCGILDLIEVVAACDAELVVLVSGQGKLRREIMARAAALDVEHRFRLLDDRPGTELRDMPDMLAAMDALLVIPLPALAYQAPFDRMIECAQSHAVPVVCTRIPGLIEVAGDGSWTIPPGDAGALFHIVRELARNPSLIESRRSAALQQAARRASASVDYARFLSTISASLPARTARLAPSHGLRSRLVP